jgi:hypothetical protein
LEEKGRGRFNMSETYSRFRPIDMLVGAFVGASIMGTGMVIARGLVENNDPIPKLELSNKPDEVVFQAASDTQIQKGIKAAMDVCRFKNADTERLEAGKTSVKVGCEQGTLNTATAIIPRAAQQTK